MKPHKNTILSIIGSKTFKYQIKLNTMIINIITSHTENIAPTNQDKCYGP